MNKRGIALLVWAGIWLVSTISLIASNGSQLWALPLGIIAFMGFFLSVGGWIRDARLNRGAQKAETKSNDFMS